MLKAGGKLILITDVAPPGVPDPHARPWPARLRRYAEPFTYASLDALLAAARCAYADVPGSGPPRLEVITWQDVHAFWRAAQASDERAEREREYLAIGGVLERLAEPVMVSKTYAEAAYREGQAALEERLAFYQPRATRLDVLADAPESQVLAKEPEIADLDTTRAPALAC